MDTLQPEAIYHIYNHAIGEENLFREDGNYLFFLKRYADYIHPIAHTYAYCLMPNHFHVLVKIRKEEELTSTFPKFETLEKLLSKQFSNLFSSYTQAYNKVYERRGSLFIKNFKRKSIACTPHLSNVIHYIHHNPIHHGFCSDIDDWYWSSYHTYLNNKKTLLERSTALDWFGGKENFISIHRDRKEKYY